MALRRFRADLHIHSCLSPCGEVEMSPRRIVDEARKAGLDIIALCDHNTAANTAAAVRAAAESGLRVFPGIEITSSEEVHILGLFESLEDIRPVETAVASNLPMPDSRKTFVRDQIIADEFDGVSGFHPAFLMGATALSAGEVVDLIHAHNGLAVASHFDRSAFGIIAQLGFIPPDLRLDALESASPDKAGGLDEASGLPVIQSSDAHQPDEIGRRTTLFLLADPSIREIRQALAGLEGRGVLRT
jgi:3',5'-nucleoside bisphosphate phosphatase